MSFLYPLFLAGIAAISLPIILHMIRRHTRKRIAFSSLMFLRTTIPRFKNRSRPENLLLLTLRCLIICLLAIAFSRPFFEKPGRDVTAGVGRRVVLLIDTSASMNREDLWRQAVNQAQSVLNDLKPTDRLCVMNFDMEKIASEKVRRPVNPALYSPRSIAVIGASQREASTCNKRANIQTIANVGFNKSCQRID